MINITVKLFAQYREGHFKVEDRTVKKGMCAQEIIDELELEKVSPLGVLMVNARHEKSSYILQEGDTIALFPKVGGG
jgi:molybdopterin converting factor small subunit